MVQTKNKATRVNRKKQVNTGLVINNPVIAKTENQKKFFKIVDKKAAISLTGCAGTGKTFIALGYALKAVELGKYDKILVIRSTVSSRDIGFLKGTKEEKVAVYEPPYISNTNKIYGRDDAYETLKKRKIIEFEPTSFMRGMTMDNTIFIVDECQNMTYQELYTIVTRIGENSKLILCGDIKQDDLTSKRYSTESGYHQILSDLYSMDGDYYDNITFDVDDIVRSGFVREFIRATYYN